MLVLSRFQRPLIGHRHCAIHALANQLMILFLFQRPLIGHRHCALDRRQIMPPF